MRARCGFALVLAALLAGAGWVAATEQTIEPLTPPVDQRVERLGGDVDQQVIPVAPGDEQRIGAHEPPSPSAKTASTVGKFVLGVTAAVVALGAMAASLILL